MTPRQRVQAVLSGTLPDRVPFNFWMDRDRMAELDREYGADFRVTRYGVDVVEAFVSLPWWPGRQPKTVDDGKTVWQVEPLVDSFPEALHMQLPDPADPAVYDDILDKRERYPDRAIFALMLAPLDILQPLRLAENLYTDLLDCPREVHAVLQRVKPVIDEAARRACAMDIDVLYLAADLCGRNGPLLSPRLLREFHFDYLRDVIDIAHSAGKKVFYHSDGLVLDILDLYVEYGIDGCNPVEPRYNDSNEFVRRSGGRLILYGALDNCNIIPNANPEEVRAHVRQQFEILGREGRLIFSSHDIPGSCPDENLDAMVGAVMECRYCA